MGLGRREDAVDTIVCIREMSMEMGLMMSGIRRRGAGGGNSHVGGESPYQATPDV